MKLKEAFLAKNANSLLVLEQYLEGKRWVEEAKKAKEVLAAKLAVGKVEVWWLSATKGTLEEEKVEAEAKVVRVKLEMGHLQVEQQKAKGSSQGSRGEAPRGIGYRQGA